MMEVLLQEIPQILFEPVAVGAVLGFFAALVFFWKKHREFYWPVTVSIVFMLAWRLAIQIISKRYASILIFPAIIFCVYACFKLEDLCKWGIPKIPERFRRMIPYLFVIGLVIASFAKAFHVNPYERYIRYSCSVAKQDAANFANPLALAEPREVRRYSYYSGLKTLEASAMNSHGEAVNASVIKTLLARCSRQCDALYLFLDEPASTAPLTGSDLGLSEGEWKLLSSQYQNRRKKKQLRLYRYLPSRGDEGNNR